MARIGLCLLFFASVAVVVLCESTAAPAAPVAAKPQAVAPAAPAAVAPAIPAPNDVMAAAINFIPQTLSNISKMFMGMLSMGK